MSMCMYNYSFDLSVYDKGQYLDVANTCAKLSMMKAIAEVKALPHYTIMGEVMYVTFHIVIFDSFFFSTVGHHKCSS